MNQNVAKRQFFSKKVVIMFIIVLKRFFFCTINFYLKHCICLNPNDDDLALQELIYDGVLTRAHVKALKIALSSFSNDVISIIESMLITKPPSNPYRCYYRYKLWEKDIICPNFFANDQNICEITIAI